MSRMPGYLMPGSALRPAGQISASITASSPGGLQPVPGVPGLQPLQPLPGLPSSSSSLGGDGVSFNFGLAPPAAPTSPVAPAAPTAPMGFGGPGIPTPGYGPGTVPQTVASLDSQNRLVDQNGNLMRDPIGNPIYGTVNQYGQLVDATGAPILDSNGNRILYSGHRYYGGWTGAAIMVGILALVIGVPAAIGAYYGTRKAEG